MKMHDKFTIAACVRVSGLTVGMRLLYLGGASHASSTPQYYSLSPFVLYIYLVDGQGPFFYSHRSLDTPEGILLSLAPPVSTYL